jgi:hypothetical protein
MVDRVRIVVPVGVSTPSVEGGVADEVVNAPVLVDRMLREVHGVVVGVQAIAAAPLVLIVGTGVLTKILVERHRSMSSGGLRQHDAREQDDGQGGSQDREDGVVAHCSSGGQGPVSLGRTGL